MDETATFEEGEIQDTEDMSSRQEQFSLSGATREPQRIYSDESSNDNSDNSDDDSDACSKPKKTKPLPPPPANRPEVPSKYKVWSIAIQEEALMENLHKCDVEVAARDRSVESYNYRVHGDCNDYKHSERPEYQYSDEDIVKCQEDRKYNVGGKRRHDDIKKRLGQRMDRFHPVKLPNLAVTAVDSVEDVAEDIVTKLRETKADLIYKIVLVLGKEKAIELYNLTKEVEDNGGMLLMNGERRRTSGGVYLQLLKRDNAIASDDMKAIFVDDVSNITHKKRRSSKKRFKKKYADFKETIIREKLLNLNTLVDLQTEAKESKTLVAEESNNLEEGEVELTVTNPPPSPATDQDTPPSHTHADSEDESEHARKCVASQGRTVITYEDDDDNDYLDVNLDVDDMDVF